jgi:hypothetical protein
MSRGRRHTTPLESLKTQSLRIEELNDDEEEMRPPLSRHSELGRSCLR